MSDPKSRRNIVVIAAVIVVVLAVVFSFSFLGVFDKPMPAFKASNGYTTYDWKGDFVNSAGNYSYGVLLPNVSSSTAVSESGYTNGYLNTTVNGSEIMEFGGGPDQEYYVFSFIANGKLPTNLHPKNLNVSYPTSLYLPHVAQGDNVTWAYMNTWFYQTQNVTNSTSEGTGWGSYNDSVESLGLLNYSADYGSEYNFSLVLSIELTVLHPALNESFDLGFNVSIPGLSSDLYSLINLNVIEVKA